MEKIALENRSEDEKKHLMDDAPLRTFLARKDVVKKEVKIDQTIFYLKTQYQPHNPHSQEQEPLIDDVPNQEDFTFETISTRLQYFSRSTREVENTALKDKVLIGGGCQQQRKSLDERRIEEKICLIDLKIG